MMGLLGLGGSGGACTLRIRRRYCGMEPWLPRDWGPAVREARPMVGNIPGDA